MGVLEYQNITPDKVQPGLSGCMPCQLLEANLPKCGLLEFSLPNTITQDHYGNDNPSHSKFVCFLFGGSNLLCSGAVQVFALRNYSKWCLVDPMGCQVGYVQGKCPVCCITALVLNLKF